MKKMKTKHNQALEDRFDRMFFCLFFCKSWEFLEAGHLFEPNMFLRPGFKNRLREGQREP